MNKLPQELLEYIIGFTDSYTKSQIPTVSRGFQIAVERFTWSEYRNRSGHALGSFLAYYRGHRSGSLRHIFVTAELPAYIRASVWEETLTEGTNAENDFMTSQISAIFKALNTLEEREKPENRPRRIYLRIEPPDQYENFWHPSLTQMWHHRLLSPEILPEVSSIRTLVIGDHESLGGGYETRVEQFLNLGIVASLICKLPNLEVLDCDGIQESRPWFYRHRSERPTAWRWEGPVRDSRHAFGKVMDIDDGSGRCSPRPHQTFVYDPLGPALRRLSQNLNKLDILECVDSSLFWPSSQEEATAPSWPYLSQLRVQFQPFLPSGAWYFRGPRGEGRRDAGYEITEESYPPGINDKILEGDEWFGYRSFKMDMFRIEPIDQNIEPLLEAFATALKNMPELKEADLFTYLKWHPDRRRKSDYPELEEKEKYRWGVKYMVGEVPRLEWEVGHWRPSKKLHQLFLDVVRYHKNVEAFEERWI